MTGGDIELVGARRGTIAALLERLEQAGVDAHDTQDGIQLRVNGGRPYSVNLATAPFPGFPTDLQAQFMALMTVAAAPPPSMKRFSRTVSCMCRSWRGWARIFGSKAMSPLYAGWKSSRRARDGHRFARLGEPGAYGPPGGGRRNHRQSRLYHLDRGFDRLEEKLRQVGADIARIPE